MSSINNDIAFIDYYSLLDIDTTSNDIDIKKSYRKKAIQYHPDKHPDEVDKYSKLWHDIQKGYEILSDPNKRIEYNIQYNRYKQRIKAEIERQKRYANEDAKIHNMRLNLENAKMRYKNNLKYNNIE